MKISVTALATALILASPAFAAKKPEAPKCIKLDEVEKKLSADVKVEKKLVGDELKRFDAYLEKGGGHAPADVDGVLVLSKVDTPVWLMVIQIKGCVAGMQPIIPEEFKRSLEHSNEDGQI